jgi:signal transduction histidine kinase/ligand-binding sensor domain-containing protein
MFYSFFCNSQENNYFLQQHINSENGLPQNTIRDAVLSTTGFLWLATEDGLVRFDGKNCKVYSTINSGLSKNRILQLLLLDDKKLYCIDEDYKVYIIDEQKINVNITAVDRLNHIGFSSFHLFNAKNLTQFKKICNLLVPENLELFDKTPFLVLENNEFIFQRDKNGILIYDQHLSLLKHIAIPNSLSIDLFQQKNELYFKTNQNEYFHISIKNGKISRLMYDKNSFKILPKNVNLINENKLFWDYKYGNVFQVINNQLYQLLVKEEKLTFIKLTANIPNYSINCVKSINNNQILLIGTHSNGLFIFRKHEFNIRISPHGSNIFYTQAIYKKNNSILTTEPFQEFVKDGRINYFGNRPNNELTSLVDNKGNFWYSTADTLESINLKTMKITRRITIHDNGAEGIGFVTLKDSNRLYATSNKSLFVYTIDSGLVKVLDYPTTQKIERVYCILHSTDSFLYIGTSVGLLKYDKNTLKLKAHLIKNTIVRTVFKTSTGIIFAGTYGNGYYAIQGNNVVSIPLDKSNSLKTVHAFIEDKNGYLWLSSNNGLFKISLTEVSNFVDKPSLNNFYYYRYSNVDGLLTNEFNGGCFPSSVQLDSSIWSLPSMQGLVWFKPDSIHSTFNNGNLFIDHVFINDTKNCSIQDNNIHTEKHNFKLSIYVSTPNWSDENNVYIEYKINDEPHWTLLKNNNTPIIIQNLSGGEHLLTIRKKTGYSIDSFESIQLKIFVPKLIYEYVWFWPLTILLLLALIYFLNKFSNYKIRKRKEKLEQIVAIKTKDLKDAILNLEIKNSIIAKSETILKQENELKTNLLYVLSHDIATPLRFMNMFLSNATKLSNNQTIQKDDLIDLKISTQNLETLLDNIVEWIKQHDETNFNSTIQSINIHKIICDKIQLFETINLKKENTILNTIPENYYIQSDKFIISMAIQNLLGNAINYTKKGIIEIGYVESDKFLKILIKDNGSGLSNNKLYQNDHLVGYGIGLKVTAELLKMINSEIQLTQNSNHPGTTATLIINKTLNNGIKKSTTC